MGSTASLLKQRFPKVAQVGSIYRENPLTIQIFLFGPFNSLTFLVDRTWFSLFTIWQLIYN